MSSSLFPTAVFVGGGGGGGDMFNFGMHISLIGSEKNLEEVWDVVIQSLHLVVLKCYFIFRFCVLQLVNATTTLSFLRFLVLE